MRHLLTPLLAVVVSVLSPIPAYAGGNTAFNYQGRLLDGGQPANGLFDFEFELWDADISGNQIGSTQIHNGVQVTDGLFVILLDFGADAFTNADRWLEVAVDTVLLIPRQPVTRVPYAIQTRGIFVNENQDVGIGTTTPDWPLQVEASSINAIYATTSAANSRVIYSLATAVNGNNFGVFGEATGSGGVGVGGLTRNNGVFGDANGPTGITIGVFGRSSSTTGRGVFGFANVSSGNAYGVFGDSGSTSGRGVYGRVTATSGTTYGVYGETNSPSGYGLYSNGNVCTTGSYQSCSDARFKESIHPLTNSLDKVLKLRGVQFDWKRDEFPDHNFSQDRQVGFIAQEVVKVLPELVAGGDDDDEFYSVSYGRMVPILVEAIKELNCEAQYKDTQITELQARLTALEALVGQLALQPEGGTK